jgi:hypothetical protein
MGDQPDARPIAQHRKIKINMYVVSGIRTHDVCVQAIKAYASESEATVTGQKFILSEVNSKTGTCKRFNQ